MSRIDLAIPDAVRYIWSVNPETRTDSRLAPTDLIISEEQKRICASLDQWHKYSVCSNCTDLHPSKCDSLICMEAKVKHRTAKICISACHFHDESVYDSFKDLFEEVVMLAKSILDSCLETLQRTNSEFAFDKSNPLPFFEFVILKCRCLDVRYDAWLVFKKLSAQKELANYAGFCTVGRLMIEIEHCVRIEEVTQNNAGLYELPPEEVQMKKYITDSPFAQLVTVQIGDWEGLEMSYPQQLLLRWVSREDREKALDRK